MSGKKEKEVVRAVRLDRGLWESLAEISTHTGVKMAALHRLGLSNLVDHVRETGHLPIPAMPVVDGVEKGGAA